MLETALLVELLWRALGEVLQTQVLEVEPVVCAEQNLAVEIGVRRIADACGTLALVARQQSPTSQVCSLTAASRYFPDQQRSI